jgi:hypothetical protein
MRISLDSRYVVFQADIDIENAHELYSVAITGGPAVKLNPPLVSGGRVSGFDVTPDGSQVVYTAEQEVDERAELYVVPVVGGAARKLSGPLVAGGNVSGIFRIEARSGRVLYVADQETNDVSELFSAPLAGGAPVKLSHPLPAGSHVDDRTWAIDAIGDRVVYTTVGRDAGGSTVYDLFAVPTAGGAAVQLNQGVRAEYGLLALNPVYAERVVFLGHGSQFGPQELFTNVTSGGGQPRVLNRSLGPGERVLGARIGPDGSRVFYNVGGPRGVLHSVFFGGGPSSVPISETSDPGYGVDGYSFWITPNSQRVVYLFQKSADSPEKLQVAGPAGGNRVDLYVPDDRHAINGLPMLSGDSQWVVIAEAPTAGGADWGVYAVPTTGGHPVRLGRGVSPMITPDSSRVLYHLDRDDPSEPGIC